MNIENVELMKEELIALANRTCWTDDMEDFNPYENAGGNIDDAYFGGASDGETILARELLKKFFGI